jgi:hypothetical protein
MARAGEFLERLESIDLIAETGKILEDNTEWIANTNRQQLLAGLNNRGEYLSPKYSEDPWFKKPGAAERYARWKKQLFPDGDRPEDVPNLIIVGVYHNAIEVRVTGQAVQYEDSASFAAAVEAKYQNTVLGLDPDNKKRGYREIVKPELVTVVCSRTGIKPG